MLIFIEFFCKKFNKYLKNSKFNDIIITQKPNVFGIRKIKIKEKKPMNKSELIEVVANETDLKKKDAEAAVNAVFAAFEKALVEGDKIQLIGFGTFDVKEKAAREGRNPATGDTIQIPASKQVRFTAGKTLKNKINA